MIEERGGEDAEDDRPRPLETRGEQECEELGLVADLADGDDQRGNEERFYFFSVRRRIGIPSLLEGTVLARPPLSIW
jgi:hypothetical protein